MFFGAILSEFSLQYISSAMSVNRVSKKKTINKNNSPCNFRLLIWKHPNLWRRAISWNCCRNCFDSSATIAGLTVSRKLLLLSCNPSKGSKGKLTPPCNEQSKKLRSGRKMSSEQDKEICQLPEMLTYILSINVCTSSEFMGEQS